MDKHKTNDQFRKLCGSLDRPALLPSQLVPEELTNIREESSAAIGDLLDCFDCTHVNGLFRYDSAPSAVAPRPNSLLCYDCAPTTTGVFPGTVKYAYATLQDRYWINNTCEELNIGFQKLVGHTHPSVWRLTECRKKNQALVAMALTQARRCEPPEELVQKNHSAPAESSEKYFRGVPGTPRSTD